MGLMICAGFCRKEGLTVCGVERVCDLGLLELFMRVAL